MLLRMLMQRRHSFITYRGSKAWYSTEIFGTIKKRSCQSWHDYFDEDHWVTKLLETPTGEWQRALCCQPPIFILRSGYDERETHEPRQIEIETEAGCGGITMLQIQEYVRDLVKKIKTAAEAYERSRQTEVIVPAGLEGLERWEFIRQSRWPPEVRRDPIELQRKLSWCENAFGTEGDYAGERWIMEEADDGTVGGSCKLLLREDEEVQDHGDADTTRT
ncbi:uncharacterized protein BDZ99DRAFT_576629 [Mytilinidion resinicola]|uniref:Uncharacterized protein n=1 Tax=Mytilinidion resinicola TaxID=574789 RepID=A0A6A6Y2K8_9PEZI|nr:uncharacterized protein BDZ99DRAFT_576629 [Mytilinidion resinicola]KAF2802753.1 hypothetical protein BDZ99DRAFT_576629 [Mytilinidion resinicola]